MRSSSRRPARGQGRSASPTKWPRSGHKCSACPSTGTSLMRIKAQTGEGNDKGREGHGPRAGERDLRGLLLEKKNEPEQKKQIDIRQGRISENYDLGLEPGRCDRDGALNQQKIQEHHP